MNKEEKEMLIAEFWLIDDEDREKEILEILIGKEVISK